MMDILYLYFSVLLFVDQVWFFCFWSNPGSKPEERKIIMMRHDWWWTGGGVCTTPPILKPPKNYF